MIQLWLGGKRIDSIFMLRQEFALHKDDAKIELCSELSRKISDGLFSQWLECCSETRQRANERERQQDDAIGMLLLDTFASDLLSGIDNEDMEKIKSALSGICGITPEIIENASLDTQSSISRSEIFSILQNKSWYQNSSQARKTLSSIATDNLVVNTDSLNIKLEYLSRNNLNHTDLYLLNLDDTPFTIRNLGHLHNVRVTGFGNPVVHFSARLRGEVLDMKANEVIFENFHLIPHGVELVNKEYRMKNMQE